MSWVLVISHTVTGCETVMPCEHTDTFSHILLFITLSITLSTFPFIWKVPSSVRDDACGEWGETGGDSEGHEMCQDRSLAPAPCCGQPWPRVRQGRVNESGPTIDLAPSPVSWYRSPHTTLASLTQMGIIPAAFCQVSMALWEAAAAVLATSFVMIMLYFHRYVRSCHIHCLSHNLSFITIMV